ncbi:alpha/beta fold hydrolase [Paracoccus sp. (in: a-proteobacteria)]|uniref:alpha/beta fold hydrolase n=1 Tax=Paracoccus sp. TaxID=267 RepID=UPI0026E00C53|nr:alpha/beta hydrolase [Paracoccus sp. (in: a-proteobacteria)]MDO5646406.1 alpha/beta hydrolase [Paracoccus sp. (in: a-proteobacteria)]
MEPAPFHQLPGDSCAPARAFWVRADDGVRLRLALWAADDPRGTVLLFPGRTEYVEKYAAVARDLNAAGWSVLAIDWRGQGMSDRLQPDPRPGHIGEFSDYQRDIVEMVVAANDLNLPRPWNLLAHSMGGCIGLAALHGGLDVARAAFSAPMWGINLRPLQQGLALGIAYLAGRMGRGGRSAPGSSRSPRTYLLDEAFSTNLLTSDVDIWARLLREAATWPDLTIGGASFDWVAKALNECTRLSQMPAPPIPALISLGGDEKIVSPQAIRDRAAAWPDARLLNIPGARHEILMERPPLRAAFMDAMLSHFAAS